MDGAEDVEFGSGTSSTTRSAENLPSDIAEDAKVDGNNDGGDDKIVKRSPPSKMSSGSTRASYLLMLQKKMSFPW